MKARRISSLVSGRMQNSRKAISMKTCKLGERKLGSGGLAPEK